MLNNYYNEIRLVLKIMYFSINLIKGNPTEGQKLFNICFDYDLQQKNSKLRLILFILLKHIMPYLIEKIDDYLLKNDWANSTIYLKRAFNSFFKLFLLFYRAFDLLNFISFTIYGKYYSLENRLFSISYVIILKYKEKTNFK